MEATTANLFQLISVTLKYCAITVFTIITLLIGKFIFLKLRLKRKIDSLDIYSPRELFPGGNLFQALGLFGRVPELSLFYYGVQALHGLTHLVNQDRNPIFSFSLGITKYIVFTKAEGVEVLLGNKDELEKSEDYIYLKSAIGEGVATSNLTKWKKQRKFWTPAFHARILEKSQKIMCEQAEILVDIMKNSVGKAFVIVGNMLKHCAFDIISESAFGIAADTQRNIFSPTIEAVDIMESIIFKRLISPWLWPDVLFNLSSTGRKFNKYNKRLSDQNYQLLKLRRGEMKQECLGLSNEEIEEKYKNCNFLELLLLQNLNNVDPLSTTEVQDEYNTFIFTGYQTVSLSLCWTLYMIGLYPEIQAKIHKELDDIFDDDATRRVTSRDFKSMAYLKCVVMETQRLYPVASMIGRKLRNDLRVKEFLLPKGSTCMVLFSALHRNPDAFPNPEIFDPDRFLDTNRKPYAYIPFSAGPRNCIAQKYAMMEIMTVLAYVLRNFKFTSLDPRDKVLINPEVTNHPSIPVRMKIDIRDQLNTFN